MGFPINYENLSLRNSTNRNQINHLLNKNSNRNILNVEFWNFKLILNNFSKKDSSDFEKSFMSLFFLTENNKNKNSDLKKYFLKNYSYFSQENIKTILGNY